MDQTLLEALLRESSARHKHLCPRQILGVRIGLTGAEAVGLAPRAAGKRLLAIVETDGCFADGVEAATGCAVGHRTLRLEDYGKIAATFVDVKTHRAVRVAPRLDARQRAQTCQPDEPRHYQAQLRAYQILPDDELLTVTPVDLASSIEEIVSVAGVRVNCAVCGEEVINEREIRQGGQSICRACAGRAYYHTRLLRPACAVLIDQTASRPSLAEVA